MKYWHIKNYAKIVSYCKTVIKFFYWFSCHCKHLDDNLDLLYKFFELKIDAIEYVIWFFDNSLHLLIISSNFFSDTGQQTTSKWHNQLNIYWNKVLWEISKSDFCCNINYKLFYMFYLSFTFLLRVVVLKFDRYVLPQAFDYNFVFNYLIWIYNI